MRLMAKLCAAVPIACLATTAMAQQEEERPTAYTYAIYYICDVTRQTRADEIIEEEIAPIYDAAVDEGIITGWGWLAHRTGGLWRRAHYYTVPSIEAIFTADDVIGARLQASGADSDQELGQICNTHEDYIWSSLFSSASALPDGNPGVGLYTYYVCDFTEQNRADELVTTVLAPVYDAHVGEGMFSSWGWQSHFIGGQYRRLATFTAVDYPTLLNTRALVLEAVADNKSAVQFNEICGSHADYMWNILIETH